MRTHTPLLLSLLSPLALSSSLSFAACSAPLLRESPLALLLLSRNVAFPPPSPLCPVWVAHPNLVSQPPQEQKSIIMLQSTLKKQKNEELLEAVLEGKMKNVAK